MATFNAIGSIGNYDESEDWQSYSERLLLYFEANEIALERRVPAFLSLIGTLAYGVVKSLSAPVKPSDRILGELIDMLNGHYTPQKSVICERFRFHKRIQSATETIPQYIVALKSLGQDCDFDRSLHERLRDQLVVGIRNSATQKKLLGEPNTLSFEKAVQIAVSMELAARDCAELNRATTGTFEDSGRASVSGVHKLFDKRPQRGERQVKRCYRCGNESHLANVCRHKDTVCGQCNKVGHLRKVCRSAGSQGQTSDRGSDGVTRSHNVNFRSNNNNFRNTVNSMSVEHDGNSGDQQVMDDDLSECLSHLFAIRDTSDIIWVPVMVEGQVLNFELDTGSKASVITECVYRSRYSHLDLQQSNMTMRTYTGEKVEALGMLSVKVRNNGNEEILPLQVVKGVGPPLLGRQWLTFVTLDWDKLSSGLHHSTNSAAHPGELEEILIQHCDVFSSELGKIKDIKAHLSLKEGSSPKFMKARPVPYALRDRVNDEISRMETAGIITKIPHSDWATPIVPVIKPDQTVRLCGDFKSTVNPVLNVNQYPMNKIEDMFAKLSDGDKFSKIDLAHAYQQMEVDDESRTLLTINTPKGLYQYNRLAFGIASAPAIFQATMDQILQNIPRVLCHQDDILVTGQNDREHLDNLTAVLDRLQQYGLKVKREKCRFMVDSVTYLGHIIDREGLHTCQDKVQAISNAPRPNNVAEVRSFLGLVQYYAKFLPNLSTIVNPLNRLLQKDVVWKWSDQCDRAFTQCKQMIASPRVLTHYNPKLPLRLACDASSYGLGAVLSHIMPNGCERPIAFASRTLNKAEQRYAQIDKEAAGIIFGVKKFHQYLYGMEFTLITDHQPLTALFAPDRAIPSLAAARLQRWALILSSYHYTIQYRASKSHANADGLSRLPLHNKISDDKDIADEVELFHVKHFEALPVSVSDIRDSTRKDTVLSAVFDAVTNGWDNEHSKVTALQPFHSRRHELSVHQGCVLWGIRVIIPSKLCKPVLDELHEGHMGIVKMKSVARSYMWWPGIDKDIETQAKSCTGCQQVQHMPTPAPVHPWVWPSAPWRRIHLDFAGPFLSQMFLIVVDAYSKWPEIIQMNSTTGEATIRAVRKLFATYGLPTSVVTDNGPQFICEDFEHFLKMNGVKHILSAPYHPATNGQAERVVQAFKRAMKAATSDTGSIQKRCEQFLLMYRSAKHCTTGESPAKLFLGRELRTKLDMLKPDIRLEMMSKQEKSMAFPDTSRTFQPGEDIWLRNYDSSGYKWVPGSVTSADGARHYTVQAGEKIHRRHIDQLREGSQHSELEHYDRDSCLTDTRAMTTPEQSPEIDITDNTSGNPSIPDMSTPTGGSSSASNHTPSGPAMVWGSSPNAANHTPSGPAMVCAPSPSAEVPVLRRSSRTRGVPDKLNL